MWWGYCTWIDQTVSFLVQGQVGPWAEQEAMEGVRPSEGSLVSRSFKADGCLGSIEITAPPL